VDSENAFASSDADAKIKATTAATVATEVSLFQAPFTFIRRFRMPGCKGDDWGEKYIFIVKVVLSVDDIEGFL
jgi:hypothetical protein